MKKLRHLVYVVSALMALSRPVSAVREGSHAQPTGAEDCVAGEPHAIINAKAKGVRDYHAEAAKDHWMREKARLPGGVELTVENGGCAHYGHVLRFQVDALPNGASPQAWLKRASELLRMFAGKSTKNDVIRGWAKVLDEQTKDKFYALGDVIAVTEGYETLRVEVDPQPNQKAVLKVTNDVAL